ncbi:MAG: triose-phosphate isomerase family protein [Patescibacteria group bacterium]
MKKDNRFILVGNWKMNPQSLSEAKKLQRAYGRIQSKYPGIVLSYAPPTVYLSPLASRTGKAPTIVAQNIFYEEEGAYTGETSIEMARSVGAQAVLIGHSERRHYFGVDEKSIGKKIKKAIYENMPMIVCIGEQERDSAGEYIDVLETQLNTVLAPFANKKTKLGLLTIAYEPLWAIGSKATRAITADELFSTYLLLEKIMSTYMSTNRAKRIPVLYGGSVDGDNIADLASVPGIDGVLVGRASLDKQELERICKNVEKS